MHHCIHIFAWCASRQEARLDAQQNKKTVSDFVILSLSQANKEPAASAQVCQALAMRALLVADPHERALAKAAVVDFMESRVPLLEANLANEAWGLDDGQTSL